MSTKLEHIKNLMDECTDLKELTELRKEYDLELLAATAERNRQREQAKKDAEEKYQAEKSALLVKIAEAERLEKFLDTQEGEMLNQFATAVGMVKTRSETYYKLRKLILEINRTTDKYDLPELEPITIDLFGGNSIAFKDMAKAIADRLVSLIAWNDNKPDRRMAVTPETIKLHPTKWGTP